ncbi:MAG: hypothetical protein WDO13_06440 [Verrucomicrobiota bacterium]
MRAPVVLLAGGKDKGLDFTGLRALVREKVKAVVLIGQMTEKLEAAWGTAVLCVRATTLADAVAQAHGLAQAGDVVLFSPGCSSFDMFKSFECSRASRTAATSSARWCKPAPPTPDFHAKHPPPHRERRNMDNNDSSPKAPETGGLKLMTVFIVVLALHVLVIGSITVYHLMSGGSDPDMTLDKAHKFKTDGNAVADASAADTGDKSATPAAAPANDAPASGTTTLVTAPPATTPPDATPAPGDTATATAASTPAPPPTAPINPATIATPAPAPAENMVAANPPAKPSPTPALIGPPAPPKSAQIPANLCRRRRSHRPSRQLLRLRPRRKCRPPRRSLPGPCTCRPVAPKPGLASAAEHHAEHVERAEHEEHIAREEHAEHPDHAAAMASAAITRCTR